MGLIFQRVLALGWWQTGCCLLLMMCDRNVLIMLSVHLGENGSKRASIMKKYNKGRCWLSQGITGNQETIILLAQLELVCCSKCANLQLPRQTYFHLSTICRLPSKLSTTRSIVDLCNGKVC